MTLSVNISGLDQITEALNNLALALGAHGVTAIIKDGAANGQRMPQQTPQTGLPAGVPGASTGLAVAQTPLFAQGPLSTQGSLPTQTPPPTQGTAAQNGWTGGVSQVSGTGAGGLTPAAGPLPTTASPQAYTQDQIAVAMTGLVDQGKQPQVMQVLAQFGAASLMQVPKEQYPALAAQMRALGAAI